MFSNFSEDTRKVLINSKLEKKELKHPYIGTEHLLLSILKNKSLNSTKILNKYGINYNNFKSKVVEIIDFGKEDNDWFVYTPLLRRIIEEAIIIAKENNDCFVEIEYLLNALFDEGEGVALRILLAMNVNIEKICKEFFIKTKSKKVKSKKKFLIEDYGYSMNEKALNNELDPVIGRDKELNRMIEILCRRIKNNPLLIGSAGVGKTAIVEELSRRIVDGTVPDKLKNKRIISISMASLVAGTKYRGEFEERINKILSEIENSDDIIIFVDEIHTLVGAGGAEGAIDASNILKPYLARGKLKLIGATTIEEYKKFLEDDRALQRRFQIINVDEPSDNDVLNILSEIKPIYEDFHDVIISDKTLETIVKLSNKYIFDRKQPDKAIDVLDEACSKVSISKNKISEKLENEYIKLKLVRCQKNDAVIKQNFSLASSLKETENIILNNINQLEYKALRSSKRKEVTDQIVAEVVKTKTNIPIYEYENVELKKIKNISKILKSKIIGQDSVIDDLSKDIKRIKLGYKFDNKPRSYLFVGPTGVGKTMLAKELAKQITNNNLIRLDMSEYKEPHSISKIIGSPPGYIGFSNINTVLDEVKIKPNAIILLDEIEKAHNDVINLFLQILDEGEAKNSKNEIIHFNNNIIIMTSNIGCRNDSLGFKNDKANIINRDLKNFLGIELVNRIDRIFIFNNLTEDSINKIILKSLEKAKNNFNLTKKNFKITNRAIRQIIKESQFNDYGARRIDKIIKYKIYDLIIDQKFSNKDKIIIETI
ncbi:MAG: ATP-dependent Clp protease ATP-binding subunit [bacterium]|nr:ATP-dependent Clp protease ATP-binding subunit [bacterium]